MSTVASGRRRRADEELELGGAAQRVTGSRRPGAGEPSNRQREEAGAGLQPRRELAAIRVDSLVYQHFVIGLR